MTIIDKIDPAILRVYLEDIHKKVRQSYRGPRTRGIILWNEREAAKKRPVRIVPDLEIERRVIDQDGHRCILYLIGNTADYR